jgi:hypothetical protein
MSVDDLSFMSACPECGEQFPDCECDYGDDLNDDKGTENYEYGEESEND